MTERSEMRLPEMQRQYVHLSLAHPRSPQRTSCGQRQAARPTVEIRRNPQTDSALRAFARDLPGARQQKPQCSQTGVWIRCWPRAESTG